MAESVNFSVLQVADGVMLPDMLLTIYVMCTSIASAINGISKSYQRMDYGLYGLDIQRTFFEGHKALSPAARLRTNDGGDAWLTSSYIR